MTELVRTSQQNTDLDDQNRFLRHINLLFYEYKKEPSGIVSVIILWPPGCSEDEPYNGPSA